MPKFLKVIVLILILAGVAVSVFYLIGKSEPEEFTVKKAIRLHLPVSDVWNLLYRYDNYTMWRTDLDSVSLPPEHGSWVEHYKNGKSYRFHLTVLEPERQMVILLDNPSKEFTGQWTFQLSPEGDQISTRLTLIETGSIANPFARAFGKVMQKAGSSTLEQYLTELAEYLNQDVQWINVP